MLLTLSTTHEPAPELGYLLHKNPTKVQTFDLPFGRAQVFYPEVTPSRCTAALLLEIDPVGLVRGRGPAGEGFSLQQYVNDRPYTASSFLSVAISQVFGSALGGRCKDRPQLAEAAIPLEARLHTVPCRPGEAFLRGLFEPLGYHVEVERHPLDERFPEWGEGWHYTLTLSKTTRLCDLLRHLYVLVPVLDNDKHYWIGDDEVDKLIRQGEGWLTEHPERESIVRRYLRHRPALAREALGRLLAVEEEAVTDDPEATRERRDREEEAVEKPLSLNEQRLAAVLAALRASGAATVLDLGCGEGRLLTLLQAEKAFTRILGMDVSPATLQVAARRLHYDRLTEAQRARLSLVQGSLLYRDERLKGFDAGVLVEVIEHLDPPRLRAAERVVFEFARSGTVIVTTPNRDYNPKWETLPAGKLRHRDHRFEWSRAEFQAWAEDVATRFGYSVRFLAVGPEDTALGSPTQMGIFARREPS